MPADWFAPGAVEVYYAGRHYIQWRYLATAVTAPEVTAHLQHTPVTTDANAPGAYQLAKANEYHVIDAVLNRINFENWNLLKNDFAGPADFVRTFKPGQLILNSEDVQLFLRYAIPSAGVAGPAGTTAGRLYMSAVLTDYKESTVNTRLQEITVRLECHPLYFYAERVFKLYSERPMDFPVVTTE